MCYPFSNHVYSRDVPLYETIFYTVLIPCRRAEKPIVSRKCCLYFLRRRRESRDNSLMNVRWQGRGLSHRKTGKKGPDQKVLVRPWKFEMMKLYNRRSGLAKMKEMPEQGTTKKFSLFVDEFQENFNVDASVSATSIIIGISFGWRSMSISSFSGKGVRPFSRYSEGNRSFIERNRFDAVRSLLEGADGCSVVFRKASIMCI